MTTRRRLLQSAGVIVLTGLAGCSALGDGDGETPTLTVRVSNQTDASEAVTVRVTDSDGSLVGEVAEETVQSGVSVAVERTGTADERYTISVRGDRWATGALWTPESCSDYTVVTTLSESEGTPEVALDSSCADS
jgi:hypothetical protein